MRINDQTMRGWAIPIIVAAATVAVLEGANLLHAGFGIIIGLVVTVLGGAALILSGRRKR